MNCSWEIFLHPNSNVIVATPITLHHEIYLGIPSAFHEIIRYFRPVMNIIGGFMYRLMRGKTIMLTMLLNIKLWTYIIIMTARLLIMLCMQYPPQVIYMTDFGPCNSYAVHIFIKCIIEVYRQMQKILCTGILQISLHFLFFTLLSNDTIASRFTMLSPPASTKLKGRYIGFTFSVCPSVDRIATSEGVSCVMFVSKFEILANSLNL